MTRTKKLTAGVMALAVATIGGYEGLRLKAYPDPATKSAPYTICYGETLNIKKGDTRTLAQCNAMFRQAIEKRYATGINKCLKNSAAIPDETYVAFLSLTYNLGVGGFCNSSVARLANAGDLRAACKRMSVFNVAAGRVNKGLINRRASEVKLCLSGL